ncbi:MAG: Holliday junction branch migration protein RuvA [Nitrospirota bacterium]
MIASIEGNLTFKSPNYLIIDVGGIGYQIFVPLSSFYFLPNIGDSIRLNIYTHLKEDAIQLYGFFSKEEKEIFISLIGVTGIGPKLAINILSGISPSDLVKAISEGNLVTLNAIPGIGRKTAERLILELKEKIGSLRGPEVSAEGIDNNYEDALSALVNLGYKRSLAEMALKQFRTDSGLNSKSVEEMIKEALKILHRK